MTDRQTDRQTDIPIDREEGRDVWGEGGEGREGGREEEMNGERERVCV